MGTFLIWMSPEPGHILPTIKLAQNLTARGHRVIYLSYGGFATDLRVLGFEVKEVFPGTSERYALESSLFNFCSSAHSIFEAFEDMSKPFPFEDVLYRELIQTAEDVRADAILVDGIKESCFHLYERLRRRRSVLKVCVHFRDLSVSEQSSACKQVLFLCPAAFELPELISENAIYGDACSFYLGASSELSCVPADKPLIYVTLGSQLSTYPNAKATIEKVMLAASTLPDVRFAVNASLGEHCRPQGTSPDIVTVGRHQHQSFVLAASVVISHGGLGSLKDCIQAGVPMLVAPQRWDQPLNGQRVAYHRLGMCLGLGVWSNKDLVRCLSIILLSPDPFHKALASMQQAFAREDQMETAASACEQMLSLRHAT